MEEQGPIQVNKLFLSYYFIRLDKQRRRFPEFRNSEWVQERSENVWKQPVKRMTSWAKTASPWICVASPQQAQVTCGRAEHLLPWPSNGEGDTQGECQRNSCREGTSLCLCNLSLWRLCATTSKKPIVGQGIYQKNAPCVEGVVINITVPTKELYKIK